MKYSNVAGMELSRIMMGCMRISDKPLEQVEKLMVEAVRAGVNAFDLADIYGKGDSEKVFGVAMKDLKLTREQYFVQTKCGIRRTEKGKWYDFSKDYILTCVDNSLQRMKTEYIDILLLHRPDTLMEGEEIAEAFAKLKQNGKVRAFGVSNFSASQMRMLQSYGVEIVANQMQFSLGNTALVDAGMNVNTAKNEAVTRAGDALEYCREKRIMMQAWSPLQYGAIEGTFVGNADFPLLNAELDALAEKYGCSPATVAVAWILRHPAKMQVVTGTTTPERMREVCGACEIELTREEWYKLYLSTGKTLP